MKYLEKVKRSLSSRNLKGKFDEEKYYGLLCIFGEIIVFLLFIFGILELEIFIGLSLIIFYIFFIYFPFHKNNTIGIFAFGVPLGVLGIYALLSGKVLFSEIKTISIIWWVFLSITFVNEFFALKKHKIRDVDIVVNCFYRNFGFITAVSLVPLSYIAFVIFAGSYFLFGKEHLILWLPIFFFWAISNIRLFLYRVLR